MGAATGQLPNASQSEGTLESDFLPSNFHVHVIKTLVQYAPCTGNNNDGDTVYKVNVYRYPDAHQVGSLGNSRHKSEQLIR